MDQDVRPWGETEQLEKRHVQAKFAIALPNQLLLPKTNNAFARFERHLHS